MEIHENRLHITIPSFIFLYISFKILISLAFRPLCFCGCTRKCTNIDLCQPVKYFFFLVQPKQLSHNTPFALQPQLKMGIKEGAKSLRPPQECFLHIGNSDRLIRSYAPFFLSSGCGSRPITVICILPGPYTQNMRKASLLRFSRYDSHTFFPYRSDSGGIS